MSDSVEHNGEKVPVASTGAEPQKTFGESAAGLKGSDVDAANRAAEQAKADEVAKDPEKAEVKAEEKADEKPAEKDGDVAVVYEPTGDAGLDLALEYIGAKGFGQDHEAVQAAITGDFSLIEKALAERGEKGYEKLLALAKDAYTRVVEKEQQAEALKEKIIFDVVGGPDQWKQIIDFAREQADEGEKAAINRMLSGSPTEQKAAALLLKNYHSNAPQTFKTPARASSSAPTGNSTSKLTPGEANAEIKKLVAKVGSDRIDSHPEYLSILSRIGK